MRALKGLKYQKKLLFPTNLCDPSRNSSERRDVNYFNIQQTMIIAKFEEFLGSRSAQGPEKSRKWKYFEK